MNDMITWLRAQLDEDQKAAEEMKKIFPTPWELVDRGWMARIVADGPHFHEVVRLDQSQAPGVGELDSVIRHALLQDPDRVLREVEAKRQLIDLHGHESRSGWSPDEDDTPGAYGNIERACMSCGSQDLAVRWPCDTLKLLASPFSDRPGYREEWRP